MLVLLLLIVLTTNSALGMHKLCMPELDAEESYWQEEHSLDAEESYVRSGDSAFNDDSSDYDAEESYYRAVPILTSKGSTRFSSPNNNKVPGQEFQQEEYYTESSLNEALEDLEIISDGELNQEAPHARANPFHEATENIEQSGPYERGNEGSRNASVEESSTNWLNYAPSKLSQPAAPAGNNGSYWYTDRLGNRQYHDKKDYTNYGGGLTVSSNLRPIGQTIVHEEMIPAAAQPTPARQPYYNQPPIQRRPDGGYYVSAAK